MLLGASGFSPVSVVWNRPDLVESERPQGGGTAVLTVRTDDHR